MNVEVHRSVRERGTTEDVVVDLDGALICGVTGGAIVRLDPSTGKWKPIADTGGRPLGLELCADGRLIVCDAHKGLLRHGVVHRVD